MISKKSMVTHSEKLTIINIKTLQPARKRVKKYKVCGMRKPPETQGFSKLLKITEETKILRQYSILKNMQN